MRLDSLTGLRWWAAFAVFLYHLAPSGAVGITSRSYFNAGHTGVEFFFILSGFVLTWSANPAVTARQFWVRRFARIWPAHFVALLLAIPVFYSFNPEPQNWWVKPVSIPVLAASVILVQGFSTNTIYLFGGNPAAWTLSCEAFFYGLFPGVRRAFRANSDLVLALAAAAAIALGIIGHLSPFLRANIPVPLRMLWLFFLGVIVALYLRRGRLLPIPSAAVITTLLVMFVATSIFSLKFWGPTVATAHRHFVAIGIPLIYTLAIWALASWELNGNKTILTHPLMVRGGEWSYAFYLVHATVLYGWRTLLGGRPETVITSLASFVICFGLTLALAGALHHFVEKPCEKRIRAWGDRRYGKN